MSWLDALLGRMYSQGQELELAGGIDFQSPMTAARNEETNRIEVRANIPIVDMPAGIGDAGKVAVVDAAGANFEYVAPGAIGLSPVPLVYATPGTYVIPIPATAKVLRIPTLIGGGGGGGSGRRGASGTARTGGGGGAGGARFAGEFPADFLRSLGAELTLTIGAGGAGGASITADDTNGANGSSGAYSEISIGGTLFLSVRGSAGGNGGRSAFVAAGGVCNARGTWLGGSGASTNADGTVASTYTYTPGACAGGGAGGGLRTSDAAYYGGIGGGAGATGAFANQAYPGDPDGKTLDGIPTYYQPGSGGGGAASEVAAPAGTGGAGQCPGGGGGGGGASSNGYASGAGGKGGDGFAVLIWEY